MKLDSLDAASVVDALDKRTEHTDGDLAALRAERDVAVARADALEAKLAAAAETMKQAVEAASSDAIATATDACNWGKAPADLAEEDLRIFSATAFRFFLATERRLSPRRKGAAHSSPTSSPPYVGSR